MERLPSNLLDPPFQDAPEGAGFGATRLEPVH